MGKKDCQKDISRLQDIQKKKLGRTKKAFEKDKAFIKNEGNSNNRNEEKGTRQIQGDAIHTTTIIIDAEIEATVTIP